MTMVIKKESLYIPAMAPASPGVIPPPSAGFDADGDGDGVPEGLFDGDNDAVAVADTLSDGEVVSEGE